jgi:hypothetical protein
MLLTASSVRSAVLCEVCVGVRDRGGAGVAVYRAAALSRAGEGPGPCVSDRTSDDLVRKE